MRLTRELTALPCHALPALRSSTRGVLRSCAAHQPNGRAQRWLASRRSLHPTWHRHQLQQLRGLQHRPGRRWPVRLRCEGDSDEGEKHGSSGGRRPPKKQSRKPLQWLRQALGGMRAQRVLRVSFNIGVLLMLMRFWPLTGRNPLNGNAASIPIEVPFSMFVQNVRNNDVTALVIEGRHMGFKLRPRSLARMLPKGAGKSAVPDLSFRTVRPADYSPPYETLSKHGVQVAVVEKQQNLFFTVGVYGLYIGLLLGALNKLPLKLPRRGAGRRHNSSGGGGVAQAAITFDDVAGVDEAKEELSEIVELLKAPERFTKLGARPPSGVLLIGPPGTGKTLLAKAVAGEAEVPFFSISASEFVELYVGMGAMRVRELFASARREAPSIVFIDEIDAVAKGRDTRLRSVGNDEREQTLNQLLTELDGFESGAGSEAGPVICIAATNRPDVLDSALLRPGRFDRRVTVERPDRLGREQILAVHIQRRSLPLAKDVSITSIASSTTGFTGADLANLVNEAALLAGRGSKGEVGLEDFERAILRAVAGIERKRSILVGAEKEVVAKHEAGHAIVSTAVQTVIPTAAAVEKLSIIPRSGGALGFTYIPPRTEDRALMFDTEIRGQMAMLMGGRAAEELTCSQVSTGAVDDIRRASSLAYQTVSEYGLCAAVGPLSISALSAGGADEAPLFGRDTGLSRLMESEARRLVEGALAVAKDAVLANRKAHDGLSRELEAQERLEGPDLAHWLLQVSAPASLRHFVLQGTIPNLARH